MHTHEMSKLDVLIETLAEKSDVQGVGAVRMRSISFFSRTPVKIIEMLDHQRNSIYDGFERDNKGQSTSISKCVFPSS